MPVVLVHEGPTLTQERYEEAVRRLTGGSSRLESPGDWPVAGLLVHAAGQGRTCTPRTPSSRRDGVDRSSGGGAAGVLTVLPARAAEPGPTRVEPVSGPTYTPPGSAGPYLFGLFKAQADGSTVPLYENWAQEQRLDGPAWTLAPGSVGLDVLAHQQGAWTLQLWVRTYLGTETGQHWSDGSIIDVQVVPFFVIGNPPGSGAIDPLDLTYGDYLTYLEYFYGGLSDAVTAVECGTPTPDPTTVGLNCLSLLWRDLQPPLLREALSLALSSVGCAVGAGSADLGVALGGCLGAGATGMELIVFVVHQALLNEPTGAGRAFLDQRMPVPGG